MTYDLAIGDRSYSSWSLRGWLLFDAFGIPVQTHSARLYTEALPKLLEGFFPARTVPALRLPDGTAMAESLAIAEELASRHPEAGLWPADPGLRAIARALAAEMHAGFGALRSHCPMNLRVSYEDCAPTEAVLADLARLEVLWAWARERSGGDWLCGAYSAADAFFAPVAARIAGYNLPVGPEAAAYVAAHLAHPSFRRWRAMGLAEGAPQDFYRRDYPTWPWPGPQPLAATVSEGPSENATCPYSGKPVTDFLRIDGRRFGFCNPFCRDKTLADPEAWPKFVAIYHS
ncbi:glutathione S-transferase [Cereibacter changlensis JA139]|uniref:Glutathione S-transferase n=2 Tax=Cereibacter changlensis TaxID=402884 RepID=A0A2T4JWT9_9RHOB|nr:glutathione S-transferase N-terminal domain-containing protein [Cereibacter changlensis]PTE22213.1 glutathione S-transferase [Cereibacter changlensis JA139]PZX50380.1 glutathione S-transferase [Cereibacter changlensis]